MTTREEYIDQNEQQPDTPTPAANTPDSPDATGQNDQQPEAAPTNEVVGDVVAEGEVISSDETETPAAAAATSELEQRLAEAEKQAADYRDQWLRSVADFKNYKRRTDTERAELIKNASADMVLKLLPVMDDFERAIENIPPDVAETAWWGGTQLISQKLRTILESAGVAPISAVGQDFDPNYHDAVLYEEAPGQEGKVVAELQKGYTMHERVLRPATVKVGKD